MDGIENGNGDKILSPKSAYITGRREECPLCVGMNHQSDTFQQNTLSSFITRFPSQAIMIPKNIIAAQIVRIFTGSISFLASGFLCFTIWVSPKGLQTPYSRIIFGFSVADILQSIGVVLSPFLSPADNPGSIFSKGTYKQTPQDFAKCEEKFIFAFIWIYAIATSVYPLIKQQINATKYGSFCMIASRPFNCESTDLVECTRGVNAKRSSLFFTIGPIVVIFLLLIIVLGAFTCYMYNAEKAIQPPSRSRPQPKNRASRLIKSLRKSKDEKETKQAEPRAKIVVPQNEQNCNYAPVETASFQKASEKLETHLLEKEEGEANQVSIQEPTPLRSSSVVNHSRTGQPSSAASEGNNSVRRVHEGMDLTKKAAQQSILYILAFMLVYSGPLLALLLRFSKTKNTSANYWIISLFYPIGGFLNMIIYTRPKVKALKELIPDLPIIICFLVILCSGGETPSLADLQLEEPPAYVTSVGLPQHEVQQEPRRPRQSEDNSSIGYWLKKIGFAVSSDEDSRDLDAELEATMRGHASFNPITRMGSRIRPQPKQDPILEEEHEYEEKDDEEDGISIGGSKEDEVISLDRESEVCSKVDNFSPPSNYSKFDLLRRK
ncbi:predicted protein [Chaetoceros tenuissimus]|uniref:Uncharacterized protein n=1 Tax=Chaetoceros tenuissimus TaxID=426638 RepID=A0AAD3DDX4_9STRA|nr:predicted protein [Chaetoceros tenuissimus]